MTDTDKLMRQIVDAGISLAYSTRGAGIAAVWAESLRPHVKVVPADHEVKTWAVNREGVFINAGWTSGASIGEAPMTVGELVFLIAHETLHIALAHEHGDATLNEAQDAVINHVLVTDGVGTFPGGKRRGVILADYRARGYAGPAESGALYEWLRKQSQQSQQSQQGKPQQGGQEKPQQGERMAGAGCAPKGTPGTGGAEGDAKGADRAKIAAEKARVTIREASNKAGAGTALAELLAPREVRTSVRSLVRRAFEKASESARNRSVPAYSRASRRGSVDPSILRPGKVGTEARVAFIGDVSGSLGADGVRTLVGFIESVAREFPEVGVYLVTHTDEVVFEGRLKAGGDLEQAKRAARFTGGTDFAPAYDAVREAGRFDVAVHFTDGYNGRAWPESPARELIVGVWGSGDGMTPLPEGARSLPVEPLR